MTTGTPQRDSQNPLPLLIQCCDNLQRYASWTPRQSVSKFCNITKGGCNKFRDECELSRNGTGDGAGYVQIVPHPHHHACWQAEGSGWCSPTKNPWGASTNVSGDCSFENPALCRTHGEPCPCYGGITPRDLENTNAPRNFSDSLGYSGDVKWTELVSKEATKNERELIQEAARQELCPYRQKERDKEGTSFAQCYLTRKQFRELQTRWLRLYTGIYAFYNLFPRRGSAQLIYCLQDPRGSIQFPFYVYTLDEETQQHWKHDSEMKYKQLVARIMRQAEAVGRDQEADFYKILNDPKSTRLTLFERELGVLYAPDGELSAFILGCLLRMRSEILDELSTTDDAWTYEFQLEIPEYINNLVSAIKTAFPKRPPIIPQRISLAGLFSALGLIKPSNSSPTERLINLVRWLTDALNSHKTYESLFGSEWIKIEATQKDVIVRELLDLHRRLKEFPDQSVTYATIQTVLKVLLSNRNLDAEEFGKRSRIGYENLFAHLAWRARSPHSRAWIVIPLHSHPFRDGQGVEFKHIAFFLGTFKDTDDEGQPLQPDDLKQTISALRLVAKSAARDYETLFLADVLINHIREILSTPGPRYAHEIDRWVSNFLNPALKLLQEHNPDDPATVKLFSLRKQLQRLHSVVMAANRKRTLRENSFDQSIWEEIKTVVTSEALPGFRDEITFEVLTADQTFRGDRDVIEAVLLGLTRNSLKYGRRDEVASIRIQIDQSPDELRLVITDSGKGFDLVLDGETYRPRIDGDKQGDEAEQGKGWSLVQIELLAGLHGGDVQYANLLEDGAISHVSYLDPGGGTVSGARIAVTLRKTRSQL